MDEILRLIDETNENQLRSLELLEDIKSFCNQTAPKSKTIYPYTPERLQKSQIIYNTPVQLKDVQCITLSDREEDQQVQSKNKVKKSKMIYSQSRKKRAKPWKQQNEPSQRSSSIRLRKHSSSFILRID